MNKIYKSIFNAVRGKWVVVSEATSSYKQPSKQNTATKCVSGLLLATAGAMISNSASAFVETNFLSKNELLQQTVGYSYSQNGLASNKTIDPTPNSEPEGPTDPNLPEDLTASSIKIGGFTFVRTINSTVYTLKKRPNDQPKTNWSFRTSETSKNNPGQTYDIDLKGANWHVFADGGTASFIHDTNKKIVFTDNFASFADNGGHAIVENRENGTIIFNGIAQLSKHNSTTEFINNGTMKFYITEDHNFARPLNWGIARFINHGEMYIQPLFEIGFTDSTTEILNTKNLTFNFVDQWDYPVITGGDLTFNQEGVNSTLTLTSDKQLELRAQSANVNFEGNLNFQPVNWNAVVSNAKDDQGIAFSPGIFTYFTYYGNFKMVMNPNQSNWDGTLVDVLATGAEGHATIENIGTLIKQSGKISDDRTYQTSYIRVLANDGATAEINNKGTLHLEGAKVNSVLSQTSSTDRQTTPVGSVIYTMAEGFNDSKAVIRNQEKGNLTLSTGTTDSSGLSSHVIKYMVRAENPSTIGAVGPYAAIKNEGRGKLLIGAYSTGGGNFNTAINSMIKLTANNDTTPMKAKAEIVNEGGGELVIEGIYDRSSAIESMITIDNCTSEACKKANHEIVALVKNTKGTMRLNTGAIGDPSIKDVNGAKAVIENHDLMYLEALALKPSTGMTFINKSGATLKAKSRALFAKAGPLLPETGTHPIGSYEKNQKKELKTITVLNNDGQLSTTVNGYEITYEGSSDDYFGDKSERVYIGQNERDVIQRQFEDGGHVVITDIIEGSLASKRLREAFEKEFGKGTQLTFALQGTETDFIRPMLDTLVSRGEVKNGSVLSNVIFSSQGGELLVGANGINQDIGFMGIKNATGIKVTEGKKLTLTGGVTNTRLVGEDVPIVLQNGTLQLGDTRLAAGEGIIGSIATDANSTVDVAHGHFTLQNVTGNGHIEVGEKGNVTLNTFSTSINNLGVVNAGGDITINAVDKSKSKALQYAFRNQGTANLKGVTMTEGAELRNAKDGKVTAGALTLNAGSELTNLGTMTLDSLTGWGTIRNKGTLNVSGQLFVPGQSTQVLAGTVNAGELVIGESTKPQASSLLALNPTAILMVQGQTFTNNLTFNSGNVQVAEGATLTQGMDKETFENFEKDHKELIKDKTLLVVDKSFKMGDNDSLWVGQDKSDKNLALGEKSLVVLTAENLKGQAMFDAKDGATLSADIAEGAQFVFEGNMLGRHYIAKGFDETSNKAFESLTITNLKDNQVMDVGSNANGVFVINGTDNIATIAPDALFKDAFNHVLNANQDTESKNAMVAWISKLISQKDVSNATLTQATMSLAQTTALAGVEQQGLARGLAMADELKASHAKDGLLWANVLHKKSDVSGLDLGKGLEADYDVKGNGLVVGAELPLSNSFALGTAVSYQKAKVEATGLQNEAETVAGSIYAKERVGAFNFMQSVTVAKTNHEVKGFNSTDVDTQALVLDLEGAYTHELSQGFAVQPYAGLRASMLKVDDSTIAMGGHDVVKHEGDADTFIQMPVGVKLQKAMETPCGWRVMGEAKLGAVTTLGDTEANSKVSAIGFTGKDGLETQVLDRTVGDFGINVMAGNKTVQMGVGYNFQGSSSVKDHQVKANLKFVF